MPHLIKYWLPVLLYAGLIFVISSIPLPEAPIDIPYFDVDKIAHFFEYAILALLIYRACVNPVRSNPDTECRDADYQRRTSNGVNSPRGWLFQNRISISIIGSMIYAFSDELHQYFVPMRQMSLYDFLADALGACCAIIVVSLVTKHVLKHN